MAKFLSALLVLTVLTSIAKADVYTDRQRAADEGKAQAQAAKAIQIYQKADRSYLANLQKFSSAHSGLAQTPECWAFDYSESSWYNSVQQVCNGSFCASVHKERGGIDLTGYESYPLYQEIAAQEGRIYYCHVVLRNGLACSVQYDFSGEHAFSGKHGKFGGNCIDSQGVNHSYQIPAKL